MRPNTVESRGSSSRDRRIDLHRGPGHGRRAAGRVPGPGVGARSSVATARRALLGPRRAGSFLAQPVLQTADALPPADRRATGHGDRAVQAAATDRRRRHGRRLDGRADAAGPAQGRAQDHQAGHGHAQVIARFEAERQALALMDHPNIAKVLDARHDRHGPAVLRDGAGQGRADHRVLRRASADAARAAGAVRAGLPGGAARASERDHPSRPEAVERPGRAATTASRCPRSSTSASPRRSGSS